MDDYDDDMEDEFPQVISYRWSWYGLATDTCALLARVAYASSQFWEDTCNNFARAHNRQVDEYDARVDGEQFAASILGGLDQL